MNKLDMPEKELSRQFEWVKVESTQIAAIGRHAILSLTRIEFAARKDGSPGPTYEYDNIEAPMYQDFMKAKSKGSFFKANIKPFAITFPYRKIEPEAAA